MRPHFVTSLWKLLAVGALFYGSYGLSNWLAAQHATVPEIAYAWESAIPFIAWTIVPYWSLNLFYGLAFFLCKSSAQQNRYIAQLVAAQLIAVASFLLFPLQFSWVKSATNGLSGYLFHTLLAFDQPYNQAPSLHIILAVIVGRFYWYRLPRLCRPLWLLWFLLIGLSVLTSWQHHFIDIPTGILVGLLILWGLPWQGNDPAGAPLKGRIRGTSRHRIASLIYAGAALLFAATASLGGGFLWLLWPALSCALMVLAYGRFGVAVMQKAANGTISFAARLLLLPQQIGAACNAWFWLRKAPLHDEIFAHKIHIGSIFSISRFSAALDFCAELPVLNKPMHYHAVPMLDMVAPSPQQLGKAAGALLQLLKKSQKPVLVCCALGYGRSVAVLLTWLIRYGGYSDIDAALQLVQQARPEIVLPASTRQAVLAATMEPTAVGWVE